MIACFIRYEIDPYRLPAFEDYARNWGQAIPRCGAEVWPAEGQRETYLDLAAALRPALERIDGFLSIQRFESLSEPSKLLSLSFWRDEAAIAAWRKLEAHRQTQAAGRRSVFHHYRLRIAGVVRDYGMTDRKQAPSDSRAVHG